MGEDQKIVAELMKLVNETKERITNIDRKLAEICTTMREREKQCAAHAISMNDHDKRIQLLELWKASKENLGHEPRLRELERLQAQQNGVGAFVWKAGPILVAVAALFHSMYAK